VNKQMEVSLLLLAPMLVALLTALPVLVPLLFSKEFQPVVGMAQVAVLAMYFKVLNMPIAYITLARSKSLSFLFLETTYFVVLVVGVMVGFRLWGIWGTGLAIVVAHMAELMTVGGYAYWQYDYRCTKAIARYAGVQTATGVAAYAVSVLAEDWCYWIAEAALTMVSTAYSVHILRQKTHLWEALKKKLRI
jgi:O-antigen/teichoic acid export membrane protein